MLDTLPNKDFDHEPVAHDSSSLSTWPLTFPACFNSLRNSLNGISRYRLASPHISNDILFLIYSDLLYLSQRILKVHTCLIANTAVCLATTNRASSFTRILWLHIVTQFSY